MRRPNDQAKLLFLYLLRSSANAWATDKVAPSAAGRAAASAAAAVGLEGHINLRLARRTDVPSIHRCNLATLPENYPHNFYLQHLKQWPELALVAEHVKPTSTSPFATGGGGSSTFDPNNDYHHHHDHDDDYDDHSNIIGYVLGKVETKPWQGKGSSRGAGPEIDIDQLDNIDNERQQQPLLMESLGHVTSLAILPQFRRQGLAAQLMDQLHLHLEECYQANAVGLHVRVSNAGAARLYGNCGYRVVQLIPGYYQDGEDAYFMRKEMISHSRSRAMGGKISSSNNINNDRIQQRQQQQQRNSNYPRGPAQGKNSRNNNKNRFGSVLSSPAPWVTNYFSTAWRRAAGSATTASAAASASASSSSRKRRPWETGPKHCRLPRSVVDLAPPTMTTTTKQQQQQTKRLMKEQAVTVDVVEREDINDDDDDDDGRHQVGTTQVITGMV